MKRNTAARAPSPTPTAFSAISNYKTESYRPMSGKSAPALPSIDSRLVAKSHYDELGRYLVSYLAKAPANSRSTARQKLARLTRQQFQELSTDIFDELLRRKKNAEGNEVPFLPVRDDFHPKRNQARQKLATLPTSRFEDLSSDVYFELARRFPEFQQSESQPSPASAYDDFPSPDFPVSPPQRAPIPSNSRSGRSSDDRPVDPPYGGPTTSGRRSEDRRKGLEEEFPPRSDAYNGAESTNNANGRRKASQDNTRRSEDRDRQRDVARKSSISNSDSTAATNAQTATATSGVVIPTKSTIAEEEIEIPFGREIGGSTGMEDRDRGRITEMDGVTDGESAGHASPIGGLSGLTARLRAGEDDDGAMSGGGNRSEDYFDKVSFGRAASAASDRSNGGSRIGGRASVTNDDQEKLRRDYEFKLATMQSRITGLERDLTDADEWVQKAKQSEDRVRQLEEELNTVRSRMDEQTTTMRNLQRELEEMRNSRNRERERETRRARQDEQELQTLREQCQKRDEDLAKRQVTADPALIERLQADMQGLLAESSDLSNRYEELMTARESDRNLIRDLDQQLKEYKRKYEQARTELRGIRATSQVFLQATKMDDELPVASDGGILDTHVIAFLAAIDALLSAGRSHVPTEVLSPMKLVVNSVTAIMDDVYAFESRPSRERADVDMEALRSLRERAEATLSNLVAAAKTHATSAGMSPISLLDAAASHVSASVTELGKTVCIRRASKAEQERLPSMSGSPIATNGLSSPRTTEETMSRKGSKSSRRANVTPYASSQQSRMTTSQGSGSSSSDAKYRPYSDQFSSDISSPPSRTDKLASDSSAPVESLEDAWSELKPYLEAQTESIVYAIQSVLSGVRSPTPSPTLNENLTQIITIVSSIVAVCNDNVPPASAQQGNEILRELSEHANKLSEVQALPEVTKESRQIMAKSSFAVANAMKGLMKL